MDIGNHFGLLTILEKAPKIQNGKAMQSAFLCECQCGTKKIVAAYKLKSGRTSSCGCLISVTAKSNKGCPPRHGHSSGGKTTKTYQSWFAMIQRCENPKNKRFADWGGRGISVCDSWHKFDNFLSDMGERPEGMTIDRINVDGNYEKANCRWADRFQQAANKRPRINHTQLSIKEN